ncbi:hypothetical protein [Streptomyces sp. NPDC018055]|uniref:hypothetical protein n=1 Tax=Streptomyces sp. NPDC018055 TaxID=3365038 RepID=UPI0037BCB8D1
MPTAMSPKIEQAAQVLRKAIADAAPALPEMSAVALLLEEEADISLGTARQRLRAAIEQSEGTIHEIRLTVSSYRRWEVQLPGAPDGVGHTWLAHRAGRSGQVEITFDEARGSHPYGAGKTSWVITSDRIQEICAARLAEIEEGKARRAAESKAHREAERDEVRRRDPEFLTVLGQLRDLLGDRQMSRVHYFFDDEEKQLEDRELNVTINAYSPESIAVLKKVLAAGLAAYAAEEAPAEDDCVLDGEVYPEHDYPPVGQGNECRRCGAEAGE